MSEEEPITESFSLRALDPHGRHNLVEFDYKTNEVKIKQPNYPLILPEGDTRLLHGENVLHALNKDLRFIPINSESVKKANKIKQDHIVIPPTDDGETKSTLVDDIVKSNRRNQFYFTDGGTQTYNQRMRARGMSTEPPPISEYNDEITSHMIYDAYIAQFEKERLLEEEGIEEDEASANTYTNNGGNVSRESGSSYADYGQSAVSSIDPLYSDSMRDTVKFMERTVYVNSEASIYHDLKYFEDPSDEHREKGEGSLLPLWRLYNTKTGKRNVTCLSFNSEYEDLLAVGFGSFDFLKSRIGNAKGIIAVYSLKNTHFPEFLYNMDASVCCVEFSKMNPSWLIVGTVDGHVHLLDLKSKFRKPILSSSVDDKHLDPVNQIVWSVNEDSVFFTISHDGIVKKFTILSNKLEGEVYIRLRNECGVCLDINQEENFAIGTESGSIYIGNFNTLTVLSRGVNTIGGDEGKFSSEALQDDGVFLQESKMHCHTVSVYSIKWNPKVPNIVLSASADWTVKVWNTSTNSLCLGFDLSSPAHDALWSSICPTTFCVVTGDGFVNYFDLIINRLDKTNSQKIVKKSVPSKIAMSGSVLVVGDDRGGVNVYKQSPNLRRELSEVDLANFVKSLV